MGSAPVIEDAGSPLTLTVSAYDNWRTR